MFALIFKEKVIQIEEKTFPVHEGLTWVETTENIKVGQEYKDGKFIAIQPKIDNRSYAEKRREAYPAIGDQLDMLYKAMDANVLPKVNDFYNAIKAVKEQFPVNV